MKEQTITIDIAHDGTLNVDAEGFEGDACLQAVDALLEDLATEPAEIARKPDEGAGRARIARGRTQRSGRS
jgi:hypothetical protein